MKIMKYNIFMGRPSWIFVIILQKQFKCNLQPNNSHNVSFQHHIYHIKVHLWIFYIFEPPVSAILNILNCPRTTSSRPVRNYSPTPKLQKSIIKKTYTVNIGSQEKEAFGPLTIIQAKLYVTIMYVVYRTHYHENVQRNIY